MRSNVAKAPLRCSPGDGAKSHLSSWWTSHTYPLTDRVKLEEGTRRGALIDLDVFSQKREVEEGGSGESLMLCHGTPKENILPIVQFNFDLAFISHGRFFGDGIYFSECPELSLRYSCSRRGQSVLHGPEEQDGTYTLILCEVLKGSLPVFKEFAAEDGRAAVIVVNEVDRVLPRYVVTLGQNSNSSGAPVSFPHLGRQGGRTTLVSGNQQQKTNLPTAVPDTPESRGTRARTALRHLRSQQPGSGSGEPRSSVLRTALEQISSRHPSSSSAAGRSLAARTALRHLDYQQSQHPGSGVGPGPDSSVLRTALERISTQQPGSASSVAALPPGILSGGRGHHASSAASMSPPRSFLSMPTLPNGRPAWCASSRQSRSASAWSSESQDQVLYFRYYYWAQKILMVQG